MAEWSIAAVLKTVELRGSGGSNPSLSATEEKFSTDDCLWQSSFFLFQLRRKFTYIKQRNKKDEHVVLSKIFSLSIKGYRERLSEAEANPYPYPYPYPNPNPNPNPKSPSKIPYSLK